MKLLPIGIQTFSEIIGRNCIYVDKTPLIHKMLTTGKAYFLSRPRRFGKSLTLSTISEIYSGSKELFTGLWIENNWNWDKIHPIIHISFNALGYVVLGLPQALTNELKAIAQQYHIELVSQSYDSLFRELIEKLAAAKGKVVILIDEYDKPLIDFLEAENLHIALKNREILRNFYSIIKNADPYIEFFLMTGVSKFSQTGVFSNLNHLSDITLNEGYATLTGYTQEELEQYFDEWLGRSLQKFKP